MPLSKKKLVSNKLMCTLLLCFKQFQSSLHFLLESGIGSLLVVNVLITSARMPTHIKKPIITITKKIPPELILIYVAFSLIFNMKMRTPMRIKGVYLPEKSPQQSSHELISLPEIHMDRPFKILKKDEFISTLKAIVAPSSRAHDMTRVKV